MRSAPDLIYDVGVANGDDSAYYLRKGYRVVGIEANPTLIPALRNRFESQIAAGLYELLHIGIAADESVADFWICDDQPELSSFDRNWASSDGARHHSVPVPTRSFGSILEQFGRAFYCKIDIEGSDYLCLEAISPPTRPSYISVEIDDAARELRCLHTLGYRRFKIISQTTFDQPRAWLASLNARATPLRRRLMASLERRLRRGTDTRWGPSGPFGEETRGKWLDVNAALELTRLLAADPRPTDWYDIHAAE